MTNSTTPSARSIPAPELGNLIHNWAWLLALGIFLVLLGTIGLGMTFSYTLATVFILGIFLVIVGLLQFIQSFTTRGWRSFLWHIVMAVLYVVAGLDIMANPFRASILLTLLLGAVLIAIGIVRIIIALQWRGLRNWIWPFIGGIAAIILGLMILTSWPVSGFWVIGLFVALEMIFSGWSYIVIALGARQIGKQYARPV